MPPLPPSWLPPLWPGTSLVATPVVVVVLERAVLAFEWLGGEEARCRHVWRCRRSCPRRRRIRRQCYDAPACAFPVPERRWRRWGMVGVVAVATTIACIVVPCPLI